MKSKTGSEDFKRGHRLERNGHVQRGQRRGGGSLKENTAHRNEPGLYKHSVNSEQSTRE